MGDRNSFKPGTAFEGYIKAQIEELYRGIGDFKDEFVIFKGDIYKKFNSLNGKVNINKGWRLGITACLGVFAGLCGGIGGILLSRFLRLL